MVTFGPRGRLGNLMFQLSACIGYGKKYNVQWGAPRNTREVPRFHEFFPGLPICEASYRGYNEHPDAFCQVHGVHKNQCHFDYHDIPFVPGGVTLHGFFQSWKYFENAKEEVRKAFTLKDYPEMRDYVSIHIRRGDYVDHAGSFPPVDAAYLGLACPKMVEFLGLGYKAIVFSDDIQYCKDHLFWNSETPSPFNVEFSEGRSEYEDLCRMASCSHHIIANSTFSWFAAYLGKNPDRIVVSPSHKRGQWFGMDAGVKQDCIDLIPPSWHEIEFR